MRREAKVKIVSYDRRGREGLIWVTSFQKVDPNTAQRRKEMRERERLRGWTALKGVTQSDQLISL